MVALTRVFRVPADVLLEPPYVVALVQPADGPEVLAVAEGDQGPGVGQLVALEPEELSRGSDSTEVWWILPRAAGRGVEA